MIYRRWACVAGAVLLCSSVLLAGVTALSSSADKVVDAPKATTLLSGQPVNLAAPGLASGPNVAPAAVESETLVGPNAALPAKATEAKTEGPNVGPVMAPAKAEVAEFKVEGPNAGPAAAPVKPEKEVSGLMSFQPVKQSRMGRDYCEPCYTNCGDGSAGTPDDWITHVVFAGIDNTTGPEGCPCSYGDYTDLVANVAAGCDLPADGELLLGSVYTEYVTAWIDWNQNQSSKLRRSISSVVVLTPR
jgi:hypothetical protein